MKKINIAIDGPSGAGKSTISKELAKKLDYVYIDTGALYRAIGLYVLNKDISTVDRDMILPVLSEIDLKIKYIDNTQRVFLNNIDVSDDIRKPEVSMAASNVSAITEVREFLLETQRSIARDNDCIMDGRDIATVILPDAQIKIFLTASSKERATRRYEELVQKGFDVKFNEILKEIEQRDYNDSTRAIAPLKPSESSIIIDTTGNTLEKSIEILYNTIVGELNAL